MLRHFSVMRPLVLLGNTHCIFLQLQWLVVTEQVANCHINNKIASRGMRDVEFKP